MPEDSTTPSVDDTTPAAPDATPAPALVIFAVARGVPRTIYAWLDQHVGEHIGAIGEADAWEEALQDPADGVWVCELRLVDDGPSDWSPEFRECRLDAHDVRPPTAEEWQRFGDGEYVWDGEIEAAREEPVGAPPTATVIVPNSPDGATINAVDEDVGQIAAALADATLAGGLSTAYHREADDALRRLWHRVHRAEDLAQRDRERRLAGEIMRHLHPEDDGPSDGPQVVDGALLEALTELRKAGPS